LGDRAISEVNTYARSGQPFLISLHFNAPHWPWEAPGDEAEAQRLTSLFHFDGGTQKTYARMVMRMDLQVGRVLQALEANNLAENTIVVFTSDNGGERFSDTWPFTGKKTELLEGGLRIPSIVRWPARIPPGHVSDQVMISMDWMPTLLEAAGAAPDPRYPMDGMSLIQELTRGTAPVPRTLYWRYKSRTQRAMRDGDWKWLKIAGNTFLFDVVNDPLERANLKNRRKDIFERMEMQYAAWEGTVLPEDPQSYSDGFTGSQLADHFAPHAASPSPPPKVD
jgi:arylsulfatase A-like enzyme